MNIYDNAILQDSIRKEERARLLWRNQNRKKKEDEASLRELESTWVQEPNGGYRERFMGSQTARFHKTTMSRTSAYPPMNFAAERYAPVVKTPVARNLAGHAQLHAGAYP